MGDDLTTLFDDPAERARLLDFGADFLGGDVREADAIAVAGLVLEFRDRALKRAAERGQQLDDRQLGMLAISMLVEAVRHRQRQ